MANASGNAVEGVAGTAWSGSTYAVPGAFASVGGGINQYATAASGDASASVNNTGSIAISAIANATGTSVAFAGARADGINQEADAPAGAASADIVNGSSISVLASANATVANTDTEAAGLALADASVSYGISQNADGITATAGLSNGADGSIDVGAIAHATGTAARSVTYGTWSGTAYNQGASAHVGAGIEQNATAEGTYTTEIGGDIFVGNAVAQITNAGTIDVHATATANATVGEGGTAFASADVGQGITQEATANGGDATVTLDNTKSIDITAIANASGNDVVGARRLAAGAATMTSPARRHRWKRASTSPLMPIRSSPLPNHASTPPPPTAMRRSR